MVHIEGKQIYFVFSQKIEKKFCAKVPPILRACHISREISIEHPSVGLASLAQLLICTIIDL